MKKQPAVWIDIYQTMGNQMVVGLECDIPELTFDGKYICIFPPGPGETDLSEAMKRAETVLAFMQGHKQVKRS